MYLQSHKAKDITMHLMKIQPRYIGRMCVEGIRAKILILGLEEGREAMGVLK